MIPRSIHGQIVHCDFPTKNGGADFSSADPAKPGPEVVPMCQYSPELHREITKGATTRVMLAIKLLMVGGVMLAIGLAWTHVRQNDSAERERRLGDQQRAMSTAFEMFQRTRQAEQHELHELQNRVDGIEVKMSDIHRMVLEQYELQRKSR